MGENTMSRIKKYIEYKGITVSAMERDAGMSNGSLASQLKHNKTIGVDKLENILKAFPEINAAWLLTGQGGMIKGEESNTREPYEHYLDDSKEHLYERLIAEKEERIRDLQSIIDDLRHQLEQQEKGNGARRGRQD